MLCPIMAKDRISNLPDDVLGKILSLVPTKVAASTTVLSKRWRKSLVPLVDSLDFDELMLFYPDRKDRGEEATSYESCLRRRHRFSDFVDKTLAQLSTCPLIKKFSLTCECVDDIPRVNRWIRFALERGCLELSLKSWCTILIDSEFFTSKSLVKLTLSGEIHPHGGLLPCGGVFFPALKTLSLVSAPFSSLEMIKSFVEGCPALEELFIYEWVSYLWSPCVKRLTITSDFSYWHQLGGHTLETPSLLYLDFSDYIVPSYDVSLHSLVEARLDLRLHVDTNEDLVDESDGDITTLIEGMSNIKSLQLTPHSLQVFYFCCPSMPLLNNLLSLSIEIDEKKGCWKAIPRLLNNSPNLQTLVIKGLVHIRKSKRMARCLSRCRVKVLEISGYKGSLGELKQMGLFLHKLECLETVKVGVEDGNNNCNYLLADLMALPRVSSQCNIQFI